MRYVAPHQSERRSPHVSVIIPAFNAALHLSRCLDGLCQSEYGDFEVLVVDDGSTDDQRQIAERFHARYFRFPASIGPGGARNFGVTQAVGTILVFVDADVVLPPDALGIVVEEMERDPDLAAVFGSYDTNPAWRDFLSQYKNLMHHFVHQNSSESAVTFWAGCGAIRKNTFEEFGGFNAEKYRRPSIEDIDLGLRLARAGRKIRLVKRLQVKHLKRWTLRGLLRADIFYRAVPWTKLILETRDLPRDLNLTWPARVSSLLVALLVLSLILMPFATSGLTGRITPLHLGSFMGAFVLILLALNRKAYIIFARQRGWWFAARAVLAHWFYFLYSGVAFGLVTAAHFLQFPTRIPRDREKVSRAPE
jgi:glycosyltransferase involved in cell wall biosynthesis